jgi:hypothetical protein
MNKTNRMKTGDESAQEIYGKFLAKDSTRIGQGLEIGIDMSEELAVYRPDKARRGRLRPLKAAWQEFIFLR